MDGVELITWNMIWNVWPWIFLYLPLAALAVLCVLCLLELPAGRRRGLAPAVGAMLAVTAVLFGGKCLLSLFNLEWRMLPKTVLGGALWALGLVSGILTARYTLRWLRDRREKLALWGMALSIYCLISAMGAGSILGGLWALTPGEQVGTWLGRTVVQGNIGLIGETYEVYEYHGPLARGAEALAWSEEPLLEESSQRVMEQGKRSAERDLGVSLSGGAAVYYRNTHGGFLSDGATFLTVSFDGMPEWAADWTPLPLTDNLAQVTDGLAEGYFPDIRQGRYFFRDRHSDSTDPADDSGLFSRSSWNFTLAVYDCGSNILYYYQLDT